MARPLRLEYEGAVYHVTSRGNDKKAVYLSEEDRQLFLKLLKDTVKKHRWLCHSYCLMDNHYHLLIETPEGNLSRGMMHLNGVYTQKFNRLHGRVGHIFQGRYKAILVEKESHLLEVSRYVVLNPVRAGMAAHPSKWKWSSYSAMVGTSNTPEFLTTDWVLGRFGKKIKTARSGYGKFVMEGIGRDDLMKGVKGGLYFGGDGFIGKLRGLLESNRDLKGVPKYQRFADKPSLSKLLRGAAGMGREERDALITKAVLKHGCSQVEIADYLGLHFSTVSRIVGKEK